MTEEKWWKNMQPLRIPTGWTVLFNKLENIEPEELSNQDRTWLFTFNEDILYLYTKTQRKRNNQIEEQKLGIDLGWYPDGDPNGSFQLVAILNDNWSFPLLQFSSRSKKDVVDMLEQWLFQEFMPPNSFIDEEVFRRNHQ